MTKKELLAERNEILKELKELHRILSTDAEEYASYLTDLNRQRMQNAMAVTAAETYLYRFGSAKWTVKHILEIMEGVDHVEE